MVWFLGFDQQLDQLGITSLDQDLDQLSLDNTSILGSVFQVLFEIFGRIAKYSWWFKIRNGLRTKEVKFMLGKS